MRTEEVQCRGKDVNEHFVLARLGFRCVFRVLCRQFIDALDICVYHVAFHGGFDLFGYEDAGRADFRYRA